jgi:hypothetical protein
MQPDKNIKGHSATPFFYAGGAKCLDRNKPDSTRDHKFLNKLFLKIKKYNFLKKIMKASLS